MTILQKIQSLLTAANTKTGESDATLTDAVQTLIDGFRQGGSGYAKKTGSFTLAENYTYNGSPTAVYRGMLIETGLSVVKAVMIWSEEWQAGSETNSCFGISVGFDSGFGVAAGTDILHYYAGGSYMRNGGNNYYNTAGQGLFFHSFSSSVPAGSFGVKVYNSSFPMRAGHTIRWEAWGEE